MMLSLHMNIYDIGVQGWPWFNVYTSIYYGLTHGMTSITTSMIRTKLTTGRRGGGGSLYYKNTFQLTFWDFAEKTPKKKNVVASWPLGLFALLREKRRCCGLSSAVCCWRPQCCCAIGVIFFGQRKKIDKYIWWMMMPSHRRGHSVSNPPYYLNIYRDPYFI